MLWQSTSEHLALGVMLDGIRNRQMTLKQLLDDASRWKPKYYNEEVSKRRDYYAGEQTNHLRAYLARRFPKTYMHMVAFCLPVFRHLCDQRATIYKAAPSRRLDKDAAATLLHRVYGEALVDHRMQRVERIAAAAGLAFLRVGFDQYDRRLVLTPYWPDKVHAVMHPDWPQHLQRAYAVVAEIVGEEGVSGDTAKNQRYEVWTRNDIGWHYSVATRDGTMQSSGSPYSVLPWVAVPYEPGDGPLYQTPESDPITLQDAVNATYSDLLYTIENQAFTQLWYAGPEPEQDLVGGPGSVWNAGEAGQFGSINYTPQISSVKEALRDIVSQILVLHAVSPSSASADPRYESGVALKVQNQPMMEARLSRIPVYREVEERVLWPVMRALWNTYGGDERFADDDVMHWAPGELAIPLDDEADFRLAQSRVAEHLSTWPSEMVRMHLAADIAAAREAYDDNRKFNAANPVTVGVPYLRSAKEAPVQIIEEEKTTDAPQKQNSDDDKK